MQQAQLMMADRGVLTRSTAWRALALITGYLITIGVPETARADRIENGIAIFSALDKVTARISKFEVPLGETKTFGALKVTPHVCFSRPLTEQPKTSTFVEVDETQLDGKDKRIFTGWMFAESPGLYGVEHPTFDVWLTECQKPTRTTAQKAPASALDGQATPPGGDARANGEGSPDPFLDRPRPRVRR